MKDVVKYVVIGVIACSLSVGATIGYFEYKNMVMREEKWPIMGWNLKGTNITLECELPSERPILPILNLESEEVTNESEAKSLALKYFPEFESAKFIETNEEGKFVLKKDATKEYLEIYRSGALSYTKVQEKNPSMNTTEFPKEKALNLTQEFILTHGGFGDFELESVGAWAEINESGEPTGVIGAWIIVYRHSYNGTPISGHGGDAIKAIVTGNGNVTFFFKLARAPTETISRVKVIPASQALNALQAFNALKKSYKRDVTIINVDVCYYSAHYTKIQQSLEPTWRFEIGGKDGEGAGYIYVNAVSGELISP